MWLRNRGQRSPVSRILLLVVGAILVSATAAYGATLGTGSSRAKAHAASAAKLTIRVALPADSPPIDIPVWVAQKEGFFAKHGLKIIATTPNIPFSSMLAAVGHQYNMTIASQPNLIDAVAEGIHDVALFGAELDVPQDPAAGVVMTKASGVTTVKQLAGKSIGAPSLTGNNYLAFECWVKKSGVKPSSVRGVQANPSDIPSLLSAGRFDGTLIFNPILDSLKAQGDVYLGDPYKGCFGTGEQNGYYTASTSWATAHKVGLADFLAAEKEAVAFIAKHKSVALNTYVKLSGLPAKVARQAVIYPPEMNFKISTADLANWERIMKSLGVLPAHAPAASKLWLRLPKAS